MADPWAIETVALRKRYGAADAVSGLDLRVPTGAIFGFLGRNGAGKTTTIKLLLGMARPTGGEARVFGLRADDPAASVAIRRRTGFVSEDGDLYDYMSAAEMVRFTARFYPRWRADLEERYRRSFALPMERKVKMLSRGMRTKLALLLALCRGADLLILDEPTSGLDPAASEEVLQALVAYVGGEGATVFLSSHQIAEVEQIADHVAIVDRGRTLVQGELEAIRDQYRRVRFTFAGEGPLPQFRSPGVVRVQRDGRVVTVLSSTGAERLLGEARALGAVASDVTAVPLKEIFLDTVAAED